MATTPPDVRWQHLGEAIGANSMVASGEPQRGRADTQQLDRRTATQTILGGDGHNKKVKPSYALFCHIGALRFSEI